MQKYHDEPKQYKGYLKSALRATRPQFCCWLDEFAQKTKTLPRALQLPSSYATMYVVAYPRLTYLVALVALWPCGPAAQETQTATVYPVDDETSVPLYTFERVSTSDGTQERVEVWFRDLDGTVALHDAVVYEDGEVVSYDSDQRQIGERYTLRVVEDRAVFVIDKDGETSLSEEDWTQDTLIVDEVPAYIREHWDTLDQGADVTFRFAVMFRGDVVGFRVSKQETRSQGEDRSLVFRLSPSNFFIRWFVQPVDMVFRDDDEKTLLEIIGLVPVKRRDGSEWKDFTGRLVWDSLK